MLWSVEWYRDGKRDGESTLYWENGRVRTRALYKNGKEVETRELPKFTRPVPAVVMDVRADESLYTAWRHMAVDEYPAAQNLDQVRSLLEIPPFLREVDERNRTGKLRSEYEDWNTFEDGIAYFLQVDEKGRVISAVANGSRAYSVGSWDTYVPLLRRLRFSPGRIRGHAVGCRVLATVDHTFVEGESV